MRSVDLDQGAFYGKVSWPAVAPERIRPECLACGSSLAGRLEGTRTWGGKLVRVYLCGCKRRRRLEVAAR
jgi:hypothetical protein